MNNVTVTIPMEGYLLEFAQKTFGNPARFPKDSPESRMLKRLLKPRPQTPDTEEPREGLRVIVPDSKDKNPNVYNYLGKFARLAIHASVSELFRADMQHFFISLRNDSRAQKELIYAYMEEKGIDERHWDTVSKIWYRIRETRRKQNNLNV